VLPNQRGFTLVEVLVVVIVLAILAMFALSLYMG
jgi:prepilin-type N-terminal cleavage/methylation domain-containing protein